MPNLLDINDLTKSEILNIWEIVSNGAVQKADGHVAWSFEGNGIRTRTTFLQAFQKLGLAYVELPNFLKTNESVEDLAGYMDSFYSLYVIRDNNHQRMVDFAAVSNRPVINAMSSNAHPCEVLTDAYYLHNKFNELKEANILLWGPMTNVLKSWHSLAQVLDVSIAHYCPTEFQVPSPNITYIQTLSERFDAIITDAWPDSFNNKDYSLTEQHLLDLGSPILLPTPPVSIGNELDFAPSTSQLFSGYSQKSLLLPVQTAIISHLLSRS